MADEIVDAVTDNVIADEKTNGEATSYTDAQIEGLMKPLRDEIERLSKERDESVPKAEIEYQNRMKELWQKEVNLELKFEGLHDFAEFFFVEEGNREELEAKIKRFKEMLGKRDLNNGFVPEGHRSADKYSLADKSKDTKAMIGSKLSKLFK
ncbi:xanthine phosphoribosyltransferase [Brevibacillus borstelensis]|uniref:hypothetical protein n=1 Tax=Brevibacillus borstelensis TaxID=45462 RepID=UPI00046A2D75|nr:hypothetical protein [Brevibacillus borstelensis]MCM3625523.1 xanthine phosphoribosyltransferase [Brevibacillus borstelensis]